MSRFCSLRSSLVLAALILAALPAMAGVSVLNRSIDTTTRGNWPAAGYGSCFFLIPNPEGVDFEDPTGPGPFSGNHSQYIYENCYGGPLFDNDPSESQVDWRIFVDNPDPRALAYAFGGNHPADAASGQWNPCRNEFRATTWDNLFHVNDPLSAELTLEVEGTIFLAYYFVDANNVCRDVTFRLYVNNVLLDTGELEDFQDGVYVVYDLAGLTGTTVIRLEGEDGPAPMTCGDPSDVFGVNTHISGVFVSGDCQPTECFICGNGVLEPGEQCDDGNATSGDGCTNCEFDGPECGNGVVENGEECDDGNQTDGDGCTDCVIDGPICGNGIVEGNEQCDDGNQTDGDGCTDCRTDDPAGGEGCTPGFWKNHTNHWQGYSTSASYSTVFGVSPSFGNITLLAALNQGGGGEKALGRHATAALLNAAHNGVDGDYTAAEVIQLVKNAYATGNFAGAHSALEDANEQACPLEGDNTNSGQVAGYDRTDDRQRRRSTTVAPPATPQTVGLQRN